MIPALSVCFVAHLSDVSCKDTHSAFTCPHWQEVLLGVYDVSLIRG